MEINIDFKEFCNEMVASGRWLDANVDYDVIFGEQRAVSMTIKLHKPIEHIDLKINIEDNKDE